MSAGAARETRDSSGSSEGGFPLMLAAVGERVRVVACNGGEAMVKRLAAMGLGLGSELQLVQREGAAGAVVMQGASRMAIGLGLLHRIRVEKV